MNQKSEQKLQNKNISHYLQTYKLEVCNVWTVLLMSHFSQLVGGLDFNWATATPCLKHCPGSCPNLPKLLLLVSLMLDFTIFGHVVSRCFAT